VAELKLQVKPFFLEIGPTKAVNMDPPRQVLPPPIFIPLERS